MNLKEIGISTTPLLWTCLGSSKTVSQTKQYCKQVCKSAQTSFKERNIRSLVFLGYSATQLALPLLPSEFATTIQSTTELYSGASDLLQGKYKKSFRKISLSVLSLSAQYSRSSHIQVAFVALTILFDLEHAIKSFRNQRFLDGTIALLCVVIRVKQNSELFLSYTKRPAPTKIERRMAVDVGSGSTKVMIADVDQNGKIVEVIHQTSLPTPYQKDLEASADGAFSPEIQEAGIATFNQIQKLGREYQVNKTCAIATSAFRTSTNGQEFAQQITQKTGIPVKIIPQSEEGILAYKSVGSSDKEFVCWDIGTGSLQIIAPSQENEKYTIYMTHTGSEPFKNHVIRSIKGNNPTQVHTPNPLSPEEIKQADSYGRRIGRAAPRELKKSIKEQKGTIIAIGRLFQNSLLPMAKGEEIRRKDLRTFIRNASNKSDEELNNPFAHVDMTNALLVLAFMKALHIHKIVVKNAISALGVLTNNSYWS